MSRRRRKPASPRETNSPMAANSYSMAPRIAGSKSNRPDSDHPLGCRVWVELEHPGVAYGVDRERAVGEPDDVGCVQAKTVAQRGDAGLQARVVAADGQVVGHRVGDWKERLVRHDVTVGGLGPVTAPYRRCLSRTPGGKLPRQHGRWRRSRNPARPTHCGTVERVAVDARG